VLLLIFIFPPLSDNNINKRTRLPFIILILRKFIAKIQFSCRHTLPAWVNSLHVFIGTVKTVAKKKAHRAPRDGVLLILFMIINLKTKTNDNIIIFYEARTF